MVCIYVYVYARTLIRYIRRGLRCCCLDKKAIPEPRLAEQQDCSPAFIILYCGASILKALLFHKYDLNSVYIGTEIYFYIFLYLTSYLMQRFWRY